MSAEREMRRVGQVKEVTSLANPIVKDIKALALKKFRDQQHAFMAEGLKLVIDALDSGWTIRTLIFSKAGKGNAAVEKVAARTVAAGGTVLEASEKVLAAITRRDNPQMVVGVFEQRLVPLSAIRPKAGDVWIALDRVRDPGNLGTLIRSAVGAGFDGILLYGDCVDPYSPKVIRSTMGTFAYCNLWSITDQEIEDLQANGFELCITAGLGGTNLYESRFSNKTILAIGSEAHGVCDALQQRATQKITIPLQPQCESLNAAVAGSICMFHISNVR